jgi:hypothetical protein
VMVQGITAGHPPAPGDVTFGDDVPPGVDYTTTPANMVWREAERTLPELRPDGPPFLLLLTEAQRAMHAEINRITNENIDRVSDVILGRPPRDPHGT